MKVFLCILISFYATTGFGRVNIYDLVREGKEKQLLISPKCARSIISHARNDFNYPELLKYTKPLKDLKLGKNFFHYTQADVLKKILHSEMKDRKAAQDLIILENGYESILSHSIPLGGVVEGGIYVAANPLTSLSYGPIQIRYRLNENAKIYIEEEDYRNKGSRTELIITALSEELANCPREIIGSLMLQETGIDLHFYDDSVEWFVIVNDDIIEETAIAEKISGIKEIVQEMSKAGRLREVRAKELKYMLDSGLLDTSQKELIREALSKKY